MSDALKRPPFFRGKREGEAPVQTKEELKKARQERRQALRFRVEDAALKVGKAGKRHAARWGVRWEWWRIRARRAAHLVHNTLAGSRIAGPASFLIIAAALGVAMTVTTLYTPSYAVTVDGETLGVVADQQVVEQAVARVERDGSSILGYDYQVDGEIQYRFGLTLKSDITQTPVIQTYFYEKLDTVSEKLRKYQVSVGEQTLGVVKDRAALETMLDELKGQYVNDDTVSAQFVEPLRVSYVYAVDDVRTIEEMRGILTENTTGETTYAVQKGDTFNGIAYQNDMSVSDLIALNPGININRLTIGEVLNVKEVIPRLSVKTVEDVTYNEAIPCPVEEVEDSSIYVGSSKIRTQGVEGDSLVNALVTYVNGRETQRDIQSSQTLREPTVTVKAVGTKPRPKTASTGSYRWPIKGRITSYFGGRRIFGSYSYHSGIDISANYGAAIVAADGGTVTFSGWKGTYGKLIIITHDNGTQTYYGHNSSLLVSTGKKVYKGQQIAKAGSTGRSTGTHCHFEVRINGTAVNPLSYLP